MISYTYSITDDFTAGVNEDRLSEEIAESSIGPDLCCIDTEEDICNIYFSTSLSGGEQTILNNIVSGHASIKASARDLADSKVLTSTTNARWVTKVNKTTEYMQGGTYKVSWYYAWKAYSSSTEILTRLRVYKQGTTPSDADIVFQYRQKASSINYQATPSNGFIFKNIDPGAYVIEFNFMRGGSDGTVMVADVSIALEHYTDEQIATIDTSGTVQMTQQQQVIKTIPSPLLLSL